VSGNAVPDALIAALLASLTQDKDGIWHADSATSPVSYPTGGHETCLGVEDGSFWFRHRNDCIAALVARHAPRGYVLDIGGGNGFVARRLIDEGHDCLLLEPGLQGARNARRLRRLPWVLCARLEQLGLRPASVPAVGLFDVVEHIADDSGFIDVIANLLMPGGLLYVTVPLHAWLWSAADDLAGHQRRYTGRTLTTLLTPRFDIEYASGFFAALLPPIALLRALPYRARRGRPAALMDTQAEHGTSEGLAARTLVRLLKPEATAIAAGRRLPLGASLIVAARRRA
jgi:SAM-dependent methyltransferase